MKNNRKTSLALLAILGVAISVNFHVPVGIVILASTLLYVVYIVSVHDYQIMVRVFPYGAVIGLAYFIRIPVLENQPILPRVLTVIALWSMVFLSIAWFTEWILRSKNKTTLQREDSKREPHNNLGKSN